MNDQEKKDRIYEINRLIRDLQDESRQLFQELAESNAEFGVDDVVKTSGRGIVYKITAICSAHSPGEVRYFGRPQKKDGSFSDKNNREIPTWFDEKLILVQKANTPA